MRLIKYAVLTAIISSQVFAHNQDSLFDLPRDMIAQIKLGNFKMGMFQLRRMNLDIAGVDIDNNTADVVINQTEYDQLIQVGLNPEIKMTKNIMKAPDQNYKTPDEIYAILKDYAAKYPDLASLQEVGKSLQGRSIWALKISDKATLKESGESAVLFNGMHHAREVMGPEVNLDIIEYLLTRYGTDEKVTHWVDSNEIWVMPMFNVDGNNIVWTQNAMWRKNARNGYGVDINRNYPYGWNACNGSSGSTGAQDYRGPNPASEPETQVMMNLIKTIRPVFDISYHSYSKLVLYPFGCPGNPAPNDDVMGEIGKSMGTLLGYKAGPTWSTIYSADGGDIDWMLMEYQVIPYVVELNSSSEGFQPSYTIRKPTVELNRKAWQLLLDRLDASGIRGQVSTTNGITVSDFSMKVERDSGKGYVNYMTYKGKPDGSFHAVLKPGNYRLIFSAPNMNSWTEEVKVESVRKDIDIQLEQTN